MSDKQNPDKKSLVSKLQEVDDDIPKILMLGKSQQGKSSLIKRMISGPIDIQIGGGRISCTKDLKFYVGDLRNVG